MDSHQSSEVGFNAFKRDLLQIPNLLCLYRLIMILMVVVLFYMHYYHLALILGISAGLTDYLDGYLARKWGMVTELGALLDTSADLIFTFVSLALATDLDIWPIYLLYVWGLRDMSVLALRASAAQQGFTLPSIFLGKLATNFLFYSFVLFSLDYVKPFGDHHWLNSSIHYLGLFGVHAGIGMQWISGSIYLRSYIQQYQSAPLGLKEEAN